MPRSVSHHRAISAIEPPLTASRCWSRNTSDISSPKSPRKSDGNSFKRRRKNRSAGIDASLRPPEQRFAAGDRQGLLEPGGFGACHPAAERSEIVRAAARVGGAAGVLTDQAVGEQPLDDAVERAGAQADGAVGELLD